MLLFSWKPSNGFSSHSKSQRTYTGLENPAPSTFPLLFWLDLPLAHCGRLMTKTGPNSPPFARVTAFAVWLWGYPHEVEFVLHPWKLSWSHELLWSVKCGRSAIISVPNPDLKRSCVYSPSFPSPLSHSPSLLLFLSFLSSFFLLFLSLISLLPQYSCYDMRTEHNPTGGGEAWRHGEQSWVNPVVSKSETCERAQAKSAKLCWFATDCIGMSEPWQAQLISTEQPRWSLDSWVKLNAIVYHWGFLLLTILVG